MERTGNGVVRHCFRTRDGVGEHKLPVGQCGTCGGETYQVLVGAWLHWATLTGECVGAGPVLTTGPAAPAVGSVGVSTGREGVML